jgi:hypothetical protein
MHARNEIEAERVDVALAGIEDEPIRHMSAHNLTDHGNLPRPRLVRRNAAAFERHRTADDARRRNHLRWNCLQTGQFKFINPGRRVNAGYIHRLRHLVRHEMYDELAGREDIFRRVLSNPSTTVGVSCPRTLKKLNGAAFAKPSDERVVTHAMGRGVTVAVRIL